MHHPPVTPEERFATLVEALRGHPGVTAPADRAHAKKGFGSSELKVRNKIFAMLVRGRLVVKVPRHRVEALVAAGGGERFDPRRDGRLMKEWLIVDPALEEQWLPLAREALEHVAAT